MSLADEFEQLRAQVKIEDVEQMGLHIKVAGEGFYVDFEIDAMTDAMKRQLFEQLTGLVITYKTLTGFMREEPKQ